MAYLVKRTCIFRLCDPQIRVSGQLVAGLYPVNPRLDPGFVAEPNELPAICVTFQRSRLAQMYPVIVIGGYWGMITAMFSIIWVHVINRWKKVEMPPMCVPAFQFCERICQIL